MRPIHKPRTRGERRYQRHVRVRKKVLGSAERPRLAVYRSLKHIYAQVIDDSTGRTLAAASDLSIENGKKGERASEVGKILAQRAKEAGITQVVFDRAGFRYHGRVKAVADGAREGGLEF
jgi:large subunit ribosomal protein L18